MVWDVYKSQYTAGAIVPSWVYSTGARAGVSMQQSIQCHSPFHVTNNKTPVTCELNLR